MCRHTLLRTTSLPLSFSLKKKSKPGKFEINRVSKLLFAYKVPAKKNNFCGTNFQTLGHVKLQKLL